MPNKNHQNPIALYVHLPWCVKKCPYCDFNSHALKDHTVNQGVQEQYGQALLVDLDHDLAQHGKQTISSIFFGGGTPSLLSPDFYYKLLDNLKKRLIFTTDIEITLEANPGTVEYHSFVDYRSAGINRVSLGVQSFNDTKLAALGRIHKSKESLVAIERIKQAGLDNFNIDIMYGLPDQTVQEAIDDLQQALNLNSTHVSWYHLTLEPNTWFYHHPPTLPNDEQCWEIHQQGLKKLEQEGFNRYEISAYAKPHYTSKHNLNYWQFGDYLGIGAGAHSKMTCKNTNSMIRKIKHRHPKQYLTQPSAIAEQQVISVDAIPFEFMLNQWRLTQGFTSEHYERKTGLPFSTVETPIQKALSLELIENKQQHFRPTQRGLQFLNDLCGLFLTDTIEGTT